MPILIISFLVLSQLPHLHHLSHRNSAFALNQVRLILFRFLPIIHLRQPICPSLFEDRPVCLGFRSVEANTPLVFS